MLSISKSLSAFGALCLTAALASASTVTLEGVNGVNDGKFYVGPVTLNVDGTSYEAFCYDGFDQTNVGDTWTADLYHESNLSSGAYFTDPSGTNYDAAYYIDYQRESWLTSQFATNPSSDWADIQHAMWMIFDPAFLTDHGLDTGSNTANADSWMTASSANYGSLASSGYTFVDSPPNTQPQFQGFIIATPEPSTLFLMCAGLLIVASILGRRRVAK